MNAMYVWPTLKQRYLGKRNMILRFTNKTSLRYLRYAGRTVSRASYMASYKRRP